VDNEEDALEVNYLLDRVSYAVNAYARVGTNYSIVTATPRKPTNEMCTTR